MIYFKVQLISFVKRKANSPIEQKKCEGHKNAIEFLFQTGLMEAIFSVNFES